MKFIGFLLLLTFSLKGFSQTITENGFVQFFYPNGKVSSEGIMVNGKPEGVWKSFYVTGVIKSYGKRINHLLDSVWVFFNETGDTTEKITYLLGKRNGYTYRYSNLKQVNTTKSNIIIAKELYVNDNREGISYYYYPNGKLKEIVLFKDNKRHGLSKEFNEDGIIITINEYFKDFLTERQPLNRRINNVPVGIWREYYSDGKIKSEKEYKEGLLNGYVKEYDVTGNLINYQLYRDDKIQAIPQSDTLDIDERVSYFENKKVKTRFYFKKNIPIGIHREYDERGKVVKSWIYDNYGKLTGTGIINDDGTREGNFVYYHDNGAIKSTGEYKNNRQHGKWNFFFKSNNLEQTGNFNNGYFNGEWKWFYNDTCLLRSEIFVNGKREGLFYELSMNKDTLERGFYVNDTKQGSWYIKSGDITERGYFVNDLKSGTWKSWYANGILMYEGNYVDGNPDGKHFFYYENGIIKEEQFYVNGIKEKTWKKYNLDGSLFITVTYQNDMETRVNGIKLAIVNK